MTATDGQLTGAFLLLCIASAATKRGNIRYWDIRAPFRSIKRESVSGCKVNGTLRSVHTDSESAWVKSNSFE